MLTHAPRQTHAWLIFLTFGKMKRGLLLLALILSVDVALGASHTVQRPRDRATVAVSFNAKWSSYGSYLQQLIERLQRRWDRTSKEDLPRGEVKIAFLLRSDGAISECSAVESSRPVLEDVCVRVVTEEAPFRKWDEKMRASLGDQQKLTVIFRHR